MIKIALTFDYELFFNDAYEPDEEVLIHPTDKLIEMLRDNDALGTFFIETCMIQKYEEFNKKNNEFRSGEKAGTLKMMKDQLHIIMKNDFELGLHLHPIWNTAIWNKEKNDWIFRDLDHMASAHEANIIVSNIKHGIGLLNGIAKQENKPSIISFRAGGYAYQPPGLLFDTLIQQGIKIDSSVCSHQFSYAKNLNYNYKKIPKDEDYWYVSNGDIKHKADGDEKKMVELPVSSVWNLPYRWTLRKRMKHNIHVPKGLSSEMLYSNGLTKLIHRIDGKISRGIAFDLDNLDYTSLLTLTDVYLKKNNQCGDRYIVAVGHPKFQDDDSISNIEHYLKECKKKFDCSFINLRDIYTKIEHE